ncbi:MAG: glycine cleavage system protein GcvH [Myxococcales bacterium]
MADQYPDSLQYTKDHEWTRISGKVATIGITPFAKDQLGDVVFLELPEVGATLVQGKPFGVVESTKAVSELFAPVSGKVLKVNKPLVEAPEQINEDPIEKGWMIEVEMTRPEEASGLLSAAQYRALLASEEH